MTTLKGVLEYLTLKSFSFSISHDSPTITKVLAEIAPRSEQNRIDGIQPVPAACAADKASIPAPATLFTRLKTDAVMDEVLSPTASTLTAAFSKEAPPPRSDRLHRLAPEISLATDRFGENAIDSGGFCFFFEASALLHVREGDTFRGV